MLKIEYVPREGIPVTPTRQKRMEKMVDEELTAGRGIMSASGWTADAALRWAKEHDRPCVLTIHPAGGYYVKVTPS